jgi:hypothetical protein
LRDAHVTGLELAFLLWSVHPGEMKDEIRIRQRGVQPLARSSPGNIRNIMARFAQAYAEIAAEKSFGTGDNDAQGS